MTIRALHMLCKVKNMLSAITYVMSCLQEHRHHQMSEEYCTEESADSSNCPGLLLDRQTMFVERSSGRVRLCQPHVFQI
jgi:hypothetical protein